MLSPKLVRLLVVFLVPILYLIIATVTLSDYGMNWDEPFHFHRGQAYLQYFLTRQKTFKNLPPYPYLTSCAGSGKACDGSPLGVIDVPKYDGRNMTYEQEISEKFPKGLGVRRSYYQTEYYNFDAFVATENGHPPTSDILAAATNKIFYQSLGVMGDIEAHHFFEVLTIFLLSLAVGYFVFKNFGPFPSVVSALSLVLYPLVFAESHFNIKDPPEAAFVGLAVILFYFAATLKKPVLFVASGIASGLALGTKFNALFLPFEVAPWFLAYLFFNWKEFTKLNKKRLLTLLLALVSVPFIALFVFYIFWPFLYTDTVNHFLTILHFYKQIGTGIPPEISQYQHRGFNFFAAYWIAITTPLPILLLSIFGGVYGVYNLLRRRKIIYLLPLVWMIVPVLRVSVANASIYGGDRQIMEFIPAMAILAGIGAVSLISFFKKYKLTAFVYALVIASFVFVGSELYKIHPNENVYFNQLIGGLPGAVKRNIPYWGNSYGNAYLQGVQWLNKNAEPNARFGLPIATMSNIPRHKIRSDISFGNWNWSGPAKEGEYEMELSHNYPQKAWYSYAYYDTYLEPVYEVKVQGIPILKLWKNDLVHTKPGYQKETEIKNFTSKISGTRLYIDFKKEVSLTRLVIKHKDVNCQKQVGGYISLSTDGVSFNREQETIDYPQVPPNAVGIDGKTFVFLFAARKARYLFVETGLNNSCILSNPRITISALNE